MTDILFRLRAETKVLRENPSMAWRGHISAELMSEAATLISQLRNRLSDLEGALKPFDKLWKMREMGILETCDHANLEGEGGRVFPKFNLIEAIKKASEALSASPSPPAMENDSSARKNVVK